MTARAMTGGCQCRRIRYTAQVDGDEAYLCHCGMCRRASGNVSLALVNLPKAAVAWERAPDRYRSSPIALRGFCSACGTSLTFEYPDSAMMDLTVGSFDDPGHFRPHHHFAIETRLEAWMDTGGLPGHRIDEHPATADRWRKAIGKLPD